MLHICSKGTCKQAPQYREQTGSQLDGASVVNNAERTGCQKGTLSPSYCRKNRGTVQQPQTLSHSTRVLFHLTPAHSPHCKSQLSLSQRLPKQDLITSFSRQRSVLTVKCQRIALPRGFSTPLHSIRKLERPSTSYNC